MSDMSSVRSYLDRFGGVSARSAPVVPAGKGLLDTMNFSFVANSGIAGISFGQGNDLVNFIHRPGLSLTYFCIVYSGDPAISYSVQFQDILGKPLHTIGLPPADGIGIKTLSEIILPTPIQTDVTRLLRLTLSANDPLKRLIVYSIMLGHN